MFSFQRILFENQVVRNFLSIPGSGKSERDICTHHVEI